MGSLLPKSFHWILVFLIFCGNILRHNIPYISNCKEPLKSTQSDNIFCNSVSWGSLLCRVVITKRTPNLKHCPADAFSLQWNELCRFGHDLGTFPCSTSLMLLITMYGSSSPSSLKIHYRFAMIDFGNLCFLYGNDIWEEKTHFKSIEPQVLSFFITVESLSTVTGR